MSRRASVFARQNPGRRRVRFPDEVVFEESIKESDGEVIMRMLRRASIDIDVDRINMAGMTALHQAVLDNNLVVVRILVQHGAQVDKVDIDSWTPLHAAAANGHHEIAKYLISRGADKNALTDEGERPLDLVDPADQVTLDILLAEEDRGERDRRMSLVFERGEPAWLRRESIREDLRRESFNNIRARKGSMWNSNAVDEEEEEEDEEGGRRDTESEQSSSEGEDRLDAPITARKLVIAPDLRKLATSMQRFQVDAAAIGKKPAVASSTCTPTPLKTPSSPIWRKEQDDRRGAPQYRTQGQGPDRSPKLSQSKCVVAKLSLDKRGADANPLVKKTTGPSLSNAKKVLIEKRPVAPSSTDKKCFTSIKLEKPRVTSELDKKRVSVAQDFKPVEDDVENLLENWRKKRVEKRER